MKRERLVIKVINVVFVHRGLSFIISVFLYQHVMLPHDSAEHTSGVCMCLWWCSRHWLDRDFIFSLIKVLVYRRRCRKCCYGSRQPSEQQQIFWSDCRFSRNRITWLWKKNQDGTVKEKTCLLSPVWAGCGGLSGQSLTSGCWWTLSASVYSDSQLRVHADQRTFSAR